MKNWSDMREAFSAINSKCNYLVMRNWEGFYDDILLEGHNDIDVLCGGRKDRETMVALLGAEKRFEKDNGIHYKISYRNRDVDLDIRTVGDGYYDKKWQKNMLINKKLSQLGFYTMNSEDYFYSLVYHAIYQKDYLTDEYLQRLRNMNLSEKMNGAGQNAFEEALFDFMTANKYCYTVPFDLSCMHSYDNRWVKRRFKYPISIRLRHFFSQEGKKNRKRNFQVFNNDLKNTKESRGIVFALLWGAKNIWGCFKN
ncbi:MAG: hypothetical protein J5590_03665 [Clostridia bacterium]|nr:hypothetical protein [Clostridia bacterium]